MESATTTDPRSEPGTFNTVEQHDTDFHAGSLHRDQNSPPDTDGFWRKPIWAQWISRESRSVMENFLVNLHIQSSLRIRRPRGLYGLTLPPEQDQRESETIFMLTPPDWLTCLGVCYGLRLRSLSSSSQGWKSSLEIMRSVPDDALIFNFCKTGNVSGVRSLLSKGCASVRDTDSRGYTPLHVSP